MKTVPLLYLSADDVYRALPMARAIESMKEAFLALSTGRVQLPVRQRVEAKGHNGVDLVMPCHSPVLNMFSTKTVTVFPDNRQRGLPTTQGLLVLTDGTTGSHRAIMDGTTLTAIRTGAASGVATDLLARSDSSTVAIFGAGIQARTQLEAVCCVRQIQRASVYTPSHSSAIEFANEMTERLGIPIQVAATPLENLQHADVVCTATSSLQPVLPGDAVPDSVHINAVGSYRPDMVEIPGNLVARAGVVVDHLASALEEAGDLIQPLRQGLIQQSHFATELGTLLQSQVPARQQHAGITLFKSVGVAIQDLYAAATALDTARELNVGTILA